MFFNCKLNVFAFLLFCCTLFLAGCGDDDSNVVASVVSQTNSSDEENDDSAEAEVTFLLYMVGENDLSSYLAENISDIKTGYGLTDINANILIYVDISTTPVLYKIDKDSNGNTVRKTVKTYDDQYSVDPDVMRQVVEEVFDLYPADRLGICFSSHANGSFYTSNTVVKRSFGEEGDEGYSMNIDDLSAALDSCPYLDMVMFDACLMGNIETAYELKDNCRLFLATPNSVPGEGFPYDEMLPDLLLMNEEGLSAAAAAYMEHFHSNSAKWDDFVAVSVTDITKLDDVALYLDSLFQSEEVQQNLYSLNRNKLQIYESGYYLYDVGDWVDSLGLSNPYVEKIHDALDAAVVYKDHSDYASVNDFGDLQIPLDDAEFSGLNTYVPPMNPYYEYSFVRFFTTLKWYKAAGYGNARFYNMFE